MDSHTYDAVRESEKAAAEVRAAEERTPVRLSQKEKEFAWTLANYNRERGEEAAKREWVAGSLEYKKIHHPEEYRREIKELARRAERDEAERAIKAEVKARAQAAIAKRESEKPAPVRTLNKWRRGLPDEGRAAAEAIERAGRDGRSGPGGGGR